MCSWRLKKIRLNQVGVVIFQLYINSHVYVERNLRIDLGDNSIREEETFVDNLFPASLPAMRPVTFAQPFATLIIATEFNCLGI